MTCTRLSLLSALLCGTLTFASAGTVWADGHEDQATCTEDGYMLVMGGIEDPSTVPDMERANAYGPAVWDLVESYDAFYLIRTTPTKVYEGEWPDWKATVVSKWPCRETGLAFWYSDAYQNEVKPLRKDAGVWDVGMFNAGPDFPAAETKDLVPDSCADPFLVVALVRPTDVERYSAYNQALADTGLGFRAGLKFLFAGRPLEVLEGTWPEDTNALVSVYPCRAAWEAFYYGDTYQNEILPMRAGAGDVTILGFDPERVE